LFCIYRKVEDLQFQIEEEAITKDDLEVTRISSYISRIYFINSTFVCWWWV